MMHFSHMVGISLLATEVGAYCSLPHCCPGSHAWLGHAKTQVDAIAKASCEEVQEEMEARARAQKNWVDPHNGGIYSFLGSNDHNEAGLMQVSTQRTTNRT